MICQTLRREWWIRPEWSSPRGENILVGEGRKQVTGITADDKMSYTGSKQSIWGWKIPGAGNLSGMVKDHSSEEVTSEWDRMSQARNDLERDSRQREHQAWVRTACPLYLFFLANNWAPSLICHRAWCKCPVLVSLQSEPLVHEWMNEWMNCKKCEISSYNRKLVNNFKQRSDIISFMW